MSLDDIRPVTLHLRDYVSPDASYHLGRRSARGPFRGTLHTHDFAEVMWLERGSLVHLINGERCSLTEGDVVFIRPGDVHTVRSSRPEHFTQMGLAFSSQTLDVLERRYFADRNWAWAATRLPATRRLDRVQLARLRELAGLLVTGPPGRLVLERVLLELLHDLAVPAAETGLPAWLDEALRRFAGDADALSRGTAGLAALAGRSSEHVNRVIRERTGRTATATINQIRLTRAAAELRTTDRPIARIAMDCGIDGVSHFYKLFNATFGVTPRQYRLHHQTPT